MDTYKKSAVVKTMQCIVSTKNIVSTKRTNKKAFTLVELIIVITILAILATIAFISFQGYNKNARDGNRLATVRNVEKGLELYQLKTTFYPIPENITGTGVIGGDTVNFVGVVGEEISKVIGIGKGPKDPSSDNYYVYGLSENKRKYQIGITLEKLESSIISKTAYAETYYAKVLGNYTYPLKIDTKLYSMPSLIFVGTGITNTNTFTGFVVDKGTNLPYGLNGNVVNTKNITALLQEITGTSSTLSLTGVDISNYSSNLALKGADTIAIETALGIKKDLVGQAIFGKNYYSNDLVTNTTSSGTTTPPPATNSCSTTLPTNATTTIGSPTIPNQAWQSISSSNPCYFSCSANYSGANCETFTDPNAITQTICTNANWYWVDDATDTIGTGFCISPRVTGGTEYISWMDIGTTRSWTRTNASPMTSSPAYADNLYGVTYDLGNYDCKILGTATSGFTKSDNSDSTSVGDDILVNRMRYLSKYKTDSTKLDDVNIDWVTIPSIPNGFTIPALYLSDCIDGVRDLKTGKTYEGVTYEQYSAPTNDVTGRQNMNKYLLGWTKVSGSHLPSAYSDIAGELRSDVNAYKGEYQIACENGKLTDANDDTDNKRIRLSSVGYTAGTGWGRSVRIVGNSGCSSQDNGSAGGRSGDLSARFVVR